jgi:hypothetical protein
MTTPDQPLTWDDLGATRLTARTGYTIAPDGTLTLWHWCTTTSQWAPTTIAADKVTSASPLNVTGRIDLTCCGLHGHIHDGTWIPTNPPRT